MFIQKKDNTIIVLSDIVVKKILLKQGFMCYTISTGHKKKGLSNTMDDHRGFGFGIAALAALVIGIFFVTGVFGAVPAAVAAVLKIFGIIGIVVSVVFVAVTVLVIVLALRTGKNDPNRGTKDEIRQLVHDKEQEINKLKSRVAVWKMELRRTAGSASDSYETNIREAERRIEELKAEILEITRKSDEAIARLNDAEYIRNNRDKAVDELVRKAQYEKDYADALKTLDGVTDTKYRENDQ